MKQSKKAENDILSILLKFSRWVPLCSAGLETTATLHIYIHVTDLYIDLEKKNEIFLLYFRVSS